jgi:ABC-type glycerol-3-phosphate transport system permease component
MKSNVFKKNRFQSVKRFAKQSLLTKIVLILFFCLFLIQFIVHCAPFIWLLNNALKTAEEYFKSSIQLTSSWSFKNFSDVFARFKVKGGTTYPGMLFNSLWITFLYVFVNVLSSICLAYAIARFRFPGRGFLYGLAIFAKTIPILGTDAAAFKLKYALGMINNPAMLWVAWAVGFDYTFIVLYGTFKGISRSFSEAARIDGANNLTVLLRVVIPQALPAVIALSVNQIMSLWNNYSISQITLNKFPNLAYGLFLFQTSSMWEANSKGIYFASVVMTALPVVILFALSQNLIIKNVAVGGLKG